MLECQNIKFIVQSKKHYRIVGFIGGQLPYFKSVTFMSSVTKVNYVTYLVFTTSYFYPPNPNDVQFLPNKLSECLEVGKCHMNRYRQFLCETSIFCQSNPRCIDHFLTELRNVYILTFLQLLFPNLEILFFFIK